MSPTEIPHFWRLSPLRQDGIAREAERREITGVPQSTWRVMQDQGLAPKPVRLGPRSVGWLRSELLAWVGARTAERDGGSHAA